MIQWAGEDSDAVHYTWEKGLSDKVEDQKIKDFEKVLQNIIKEHDYKTILTNYKNAFHLEHEYTSRTKRAYIGYVGSITVKDDKDACTPPDLKQDDTAASCRYEKLPTGRNYQCVVDENSVDCRTLFYISKFESDKIEFETPTWISPKYLYARAYVAFNENRSTIYDKVFGTMSLSDCMLQLAAAVKSKNNSDRLTSFA